MELKKLDTNVHDLQLVSELIYETDKDLFKIFFDKDREKALLKLQKIIKAGKNCYGYEHIHVAEDDSGDVMGILTAFRGDEIKFLEEARIYAGNIGGADFVKMILVKPIFDRISASSIGGDDFYIGNIAVDPNIRGGGIGTFLLKESFKVAREKNCKRMLLDVLFYNKKAKQWYEKHSFKVCGEKRFKWFGLDEGKDGTWGMECLL